MSVRCSIAAIGMLVARSLGAARFASAARTTSAVVTANTDGFRLREPRCRREAPAPRRPHRDGPSAALGWSPRILILAYYFNERRDGWPPRSGCYNRSSLRWLHINREPR